ncbi:glycosyltransferase [Trypanosoma conorhini]|uniref:Glycosyltransferase n=1 Tax=Trypanosoma conorhini TaxID=83891 RepID=A0A422N450_9TRYP|nr:glycosyltransferase [Trypanosoma conorhini]RNF00236.1 glycosyltransferase [Trypanosoma conorhini]
MTSASPSSLPPAARRSRQRRQRRLRAFAAVTLLVCFVVLACSKLAAPRESLAPVGQAAPTAVQPAVAERQAVEEEPNLLPYWEDALDAQARNDSATAAWGCDWFVAPVGETPRLAPMCAVGGGSSSSHGTEPFKPLCSREELASGSLAVHGGATRANCVKRGFQRKCHVENLILRQGNLFTFKAGRGALPSVLFLADGVREWLGRHHQYYGTPLREVPPAMAEARPAILSHCKFLVTAPVVFIFRMSGHSTYHLWRNNLGPFFATLHDDFGRGGGGGAAGVFGGEPPVLITVDQKPRAGPKAPHLLDELLHYFTTLPILDASEFTAPTCFTRAILGISASGFNQAALRHWLLPRIALRHRLSQFYMQRNGRSGAAVSCARATTLRCLPPHYGRRLPTAFNQWLAWRLRRWRRLPRQPRVMYLSRNHPNITRGRKVVNEAEVMPALEAAVLAATGAPLRRVFFEELAYVEQIAAMAATNILIAPHGGGVANCVWMPPGSVVVEFVPPAGATLPGMYRKMCRGAAGGGVPPIEHIAFVAEQDPAELSPGFAAANRAWRGNKRLFSNIWMPRQRLLEHLDRALELYRQAWERARREEAWRVY